MLLERKGRLDMRDVSKQFGQTGFIGALVFITCLRHLK